MDDLSIGGDGVGDDEELAALILRARPAHPARTPAVLAALDELQEAARRRGLRSRPWERARGRGRRSAVVATAVVVALATTATATAAVVGARTGWFTHASTESDASEWLDTASVGYRPTVESLAPPYVAYPPGVGAADAATWVVASTSASGGLVQETSVVRAYEVFAQCTWVRAWYRATTADEAERAADQITASTTWPALVATDGGGITEAMRALARAARTGDDDGVAAAARLVCPASLVSGDDP